MAVTAAQWKRAVKPVVGEEGGWVFRGKLTYQQPVGWVLLGVLGEGSAGRPGGVYIWSVVMPLFIPAGTLFLTWSERVAPAGTFSPAHEAEFQAAVEDAVGRLPSEAEALASLAAGTSEAAEGARLLLSKPDGTPEMRAVRDATVQSLRLA